MRPQEIVQSTFEMSQKAVPVVEGIIQLPPKIAGFVFQHAKRMVADTTELVLQTKPQPELARELAGEHELQKAEKRLDNIKMAQEADMPEIVFEERAKLAEVVIEAGETPIVPWEVTDEIIEMAIKVEVDPEFEPLLEDEKQDKYKKVIKKHKRKPPAKRDVVEDMFRYRENKL
jgi:hypothetical protein